MYWKRLANGDIGIVTILHKRMHQIAGVEDEFEWLCCTNRLTVRVPLLRTDSSHGLSFGCAESSEAVEYGDTDLELGDLTVEVARGQALAQEFDAAHLGLGAASAVIPAPSSPDGSTETVRCAQDFVSGDCPSCVGLAGFGVLAGLE